MVKIQGITNIWVLNVRYIAIDRNFPHHLNSFDNIPINYNKGLLTNITIQTTTIKYYQNTINYTNLCNINSLTYNKFSLPLTNNKILLFLTSIYSRTTSTGTLDLRIKTEPIN